jgi:hypothetical protein
VRRIFFEFLLPEKRNYVGERAQLPILVKFGKKTRIERRELMVIVDIDAW